MTRGVSRGLFGTTASNARQMVPSDPADAAARAFERHTNSPHDLSLWKERREWALHLARGNADLYGRRLFSEEARKKARYVARVAGRARKGQLPDGKAWGYLRTALEKVYVELGGRA